VAVVELADHLEAEQMAQAALVVVELVMEVLEA
jgi:hypothetical protein